MVVQRPPFEPLCGCVCVVHEDTNVYNDMGMTGITGITMDIQVLHFQCPHNSKRL